MAIGGAFGRLFAQYTIQVVEPDAVLAGYALVGGATLLASVTHTYSTTMIVMEMTGNIQGEDSPSNILCGLIFF